jgi:hypothetical protein
MVPAWSVCLLTLNMAHPRSRHAEPFSARCGVLQSRNAMQRAGLMQQQQQQEAAQRSACKGMLMPP